MNFKEDRHTWLINLMMDLIWVKYRFQQERIQSHLVDQFTYPFVICLSHINTRHTNLFLALSHQYPIQQSFPGSVTPIPDTTTFSRPSHTNTRCNNIFLALSHQYPTQQSFPGSLTPIPDTTIFLLALSHQYPT